MMSVPASPPMIAPTSSPAPPTIISALFSAVSPLPRSLGAGTGSRVGGAVGSRTPAACRSGRGAGGAGAAGARGAGRGRPAPPGGQPFGARRERDGRCGDRGVPAWRGGGRGRARRRAKGVRRALRVRVRGDGGGRGGGQHECDGGEAGDE